jgi:hypothetical protein
MTETVQTKPTELPETLNVSNIDDFVSLLTGWHVTKVKVLEHMLSIPEGTEVEFEGQTLVLTADILKGFVIGLNVALAELGILPFAAVEESTTSDEPKGS